MRTNKTTTVDKKSLAMARVAAVANIDFEDDEDDEPVFTTEKAKKATNKPAKKEAVAMTKKISTKTATKKSAPVAAKPEKSAAKKKAKSETPVRLFVTAKMSGKGNGYIAVNLYEDSRVTGNKGVKLASICAFDIESGKDTDYSNNGDVAWNALISAMKPAEKIAKPDYKFKVVDGYTAHVKGKDWVLEKGGKFFTYAE